MTFTVSVPAADRSLLTLAEMKKAVGILDADTTQDDYLTAYGLAVSDLIARACNVREDGVNPPTLLQETIVETIRPIAGFPQKDIPLARRFVSEITTLVYGGVTLDGADFECDASPAILRKVVGEYNGVWTTQAIVITYTAGFATIPTDLKLAATLEFKTRFTSDARDPMLRMESVVGVGQREYFAAGASGSNGIPVTSSVSPTVAMMIAPYRTTGWAQ